MAESLHCLTPLPSFVHSRNALSHVSPVAVSQCPRRQVRGKRGFSPVRPVEIAIKVPSAALFFGVCQPSRQIAADMATLLINIPH